MEIAISNWNMECALYRAVDFKKLKTHGQELKLDFLADQEVRWMDDSKIIRKLYKSIPGQEEFGLEGCQRLDGEMAYCEISDSWGSVHPHQDWNGWMMVLEQAKCSYISCGDEEDRKIIEERQKD